MSTPRFYTRLNLNKAELLNTAIITLTALYIIAIFAYNHSNPSYTETFKIISKEFIPKSNERHVSYRKSGRYGTIRPFSTFIPAHYLVDIQWGEGTYLLYAPKEKGYLLQDDRITFTYRILKSGWLRVLEFHDTHVQTDTVEILEFGIFELDEDSKQDFTPGKLISETDQIPAKIGITFGYTFKAAGNPEGAYTKLVYEIIYPGLMDPDSKDLVYRNQSLAAVEIGSDNSTFYLFEYDWELVPGEWTFRIKEGDQVLAEKTFTVFKP